MNFIFAKRFYNYSAAFLSDGISAKGRIRPNGERTPYFVGATDSQIFFEEVNAAMGYFHYKQKRQNSNQHRAGYARPGDYRSGLKQSAQRNL